MERFKEIIRLFETVELEFLLNKTAEQIHNDLPQILTEKQKNKLLETYSITQQDLLIFGDYSKHLFTSAASEKSFDQVKLILKKNKVEQEKVEVFEQVFIQNVKQIWDKLRLLNHATENHVRQSTLSLSLPIASSSLPLEQELSGKLKYQFDPEVRQPQLEIKFSLGQESVRQLQSGEEDTEQLVIQLDKTAMQTLFEQTERIKDHLDNLMSMV